MSDQPTAIEVIAQLRKVNKDADEATLQQYAHQFVAYLEAQNNIARFGNVVSHPRTAAPMANPYLPIRAAAAKEMKSAGRRLKTDKLWQHYANELNPPPTASTE